MSNAYVHCVPPADPVLVDTGSGFTIACSDNSIPQFLPVLSGLADLAWSDVNTLIGALLLSCTIAASWNIIGKMFYRG